MKMKMTNKIMWIVMTTCALLLFLLAFLQGVAKLGLDDKLSNDIGSFLLIIAAGAYFYGMRQRRIDEREKKVAEDEQASGTTQAEEAIIEYEKKED